MKFFKKIENKFKALGDREKGKLVLKPRRDWAILISAFFVFVVTSIIFHYSIFVELGEDDIQINIESEKILNEKRLNEAIMFDQERRDEFRALQEETISVPDPAV